MALRGKKPEAVEKRLKALFFGPAGVGKTTAAIQFPKPYLIDTERGAENDQYRKALASKGGAIFATTDFEEIIEEVKGLLSEKHDFQTVIIDPLTGVYNDLLDKSARSLATKEDPEGMAFGRHRVKADRRVKQLLTLLLRLDMNVIITAHGKIVWGEGMVKLGNTFDCYAKLDYLFDLVFEIQKRGTERTGIIRKTRVETLPEGETFPFTYDEIANRYGRSVLERAAVPVKLASPEQVEKIKVMLSERKDGEDLSDKWLGRADCADFTEMSEAIIVKCLAFLSNPAPVAVATA